MATAAQGIAPRPPRRWVRWLKRIFAALLLLALALVLCGLVYEALARRADARRFPQQGHSVDVGGHRLNIYCAGEGQPTVILESGLGVPGAGWNLVLPDVAQFTRVCWYDRAGYGWSDGGPMPRTSSQIAKELHTLLQNSGVTPPYVLVGHSFGGFNIRVFHGQYPNEVAGAVFVDSSNEDQEKYLPPVFRKLMQEQTQPSAWKKALGAAMTRLGVHRYSYKHSPEAAKLPADFLEEEIHLSMQPYFEAATFSEITNFSKSADEVRASGTFGDKPVLVLTAGKSGDVSQMPAGVTKKELDDFQELWIKDLQMRLAHLSTRGKQTIVPDSTHMIPFERPNRVVEAIQEVVKAAKIPNKN